MLFQSVDQFLTSGFAPRVYIVGTGPAGMTLAMRLAEHKVPCLLIEAGGFDFSPTSQDIYRGEVIGDPYHKLHEARLRQFGGTSGHWSGWVYPLNASDFQARPWMPHSGWPVSTADVDPYSLAADKILQVVAHMPDRPMTEDIDYIQYRFSPPTRFGTVYRDGVLQSQSIGLLLNTPVLELVPGNNKRIERLKISQGESTREIKVDQVCVCTGGIENSRLLLWSNARHNGGVVPHADAVGRYWMEHPVHVLADVVTTSGYEMKFESPSPAKWYFAPSDHAKKTFGIGGAHIWMRAHQNEASYTKELVHRLACVAPEWSNRQLKRFGKEYHCGAYIQSEFEQFPRPDNRIELDTATDALGVRRSRLYWTKGESERRTAFDMTRLLGEALIKNDIGRARMRDFLTYRTGWPLDDQQGGWHHMGGTRMAETPATGVVDKNCKVFDVDNLYVGGSSIFTTSGHASPTYNLVRFALRLGDHLAGKLNDT